MTNKTFFALILSAVMCVPFAASAQITIGSGEPPSRWSVLDLDNFERAQPLALHLPRLTTDEREELTPMLTEEAKGLMIFRTDVMEIDGEDVGCLEIWNGRVWISFCACSRPNNQ